MSANYIYRTSVILTSLIVSIFCAGTNDLWGFARATGYMFSLAHLSYFMLSSRKAFGADLDYLFFLMTCVRHSANSAISTSQAEWLKFAKSH